MLTRRFFLAQIAALSPAEGASSPWKLATGLNGFGSSEQYHGKKYDYDEILEFTRDEGFQGIEAWRNWRGGYPDPDDAAGVREMREKVESYGLQIFSIQAGGPRGVNPVTTDTRSGRTTRTASSATSTWLSSLAATPWGYGRAAARQQRA